MSDSEAATEDPIDRIILEVLDLLEQGRHDAAEELLQKLHPEQSQAVKKRLDHLARIGFLRPP
jgi:hypothetical protein